MQNSADLQLLRYFSRYCLSLILQTSVTDVLQAMGAVPAGFRETTLGKMATEGK